MAPLRIRQLVAEVVPTGNTAVAMVPAGQRWLVTDVRLEALGASTYFGLYIVDGSDTYSLATWFPPAEFITEALVDAFVVVDEGQSLVTYAEAVDHSLLISGHVFQTP